MHAADRLIGDGGQEVGDGSAVREFGLRPDLEQWLEHKTAFVEPGMRHRQTVLVDRRGTVEHDVEIQGAGTPTLEALPAVLSFDPETLFEKLPSRQMGIEHRNRVEVRPLLGTSHGSGLVQRGCGDEVTQLTERTDRFGDVPGPVVEIGSEADRSPDGRHWLLPGRLAGNESPAFRAERAPSNLLDHRSGNDPIPDEVAVD